jgi:membrane protease YdiL (CAAX protease family)
MQDVMNKSNMKNESLIGFFALIFLFSVPFYILNALAYLKIVGKPEIGPLYISLITATPITAASILTFRKTGKTGLVKLLKRIFDFKRIERKRWYLVCICLMPLIFLLSISLIIFAGTIVPSNLAPLMAAPLLLIFFFILATGEEVGWMGYAFESMQARSSALRAAILLGAIWAFWHVPFFIFMMPDPLVLCTRVIILVGARILFAWIYNNTGKSVFSVILIHACDNTALMCMPKIDDIIPLGIIVHGGFILISAIIVTVLWGGRTLSRYRFGHRRSFNSNTNMT